MKGAIPRKEPELYIATDPMLRSSYMIGIRTTDMWRRDLRSGEVFLR
jgi:hypothetical protein